MINQELLFYIKEQLRAGATKEMLREVLVSRAGWNSADVDEALRFVVAPEVGKVTPVAPMAQPNQVAQMPNIAKNEALTKPEEKIVVDNKISQTSFSNNNPINKPIVGVNPLGVDVYAPTQANKTPYFTGMPSMSALGVNKTKEIEPSRNTATPLSYSKKKKGLGRSLFFGIIFASLVALGLYVYRFYINPTTDYILKSANSNFSELQSLTYNTTITGKIPYSYEIGEVMQDLGIIIPPDMVQNTEIPTVATFVGEISNMQTVSSSSVSFSVKTQDQKLIDTVFDGEAIYNKETVYLKLNEIKSVEYLSDFFGATDTWFSQNLSEKVDDPFSQFIGSTFTGILSMHELVDLFIKNDVVVITSELPEAVIDDMDMVRYQFSFSTDKALEAISPEPTHLRNLISNLNISDGEIFISRKTLLPYKISFVVRPKNDLNGAENISFKIETTLTGFDVPVETKPIPSSVSFTDRHKEITDKYRDTQIKNTLATARAIADIYYSNKKSYLGFCKSSLDVGAASLIGPLEGVTGVGSVVCADTKKTFVLAVPLSSGMYFCVDNIASALSREKAPTLSCVGE